MLIQSHLKPAHSFRTYNQPPQQDPPQEDLPSENRGDAFFRGVDVTADWMTRIDGTLMGAGVGYFVGGALGAATGNPGAVLVGMGLGTLVGGYGGYQGGVFVSNLAGDIGSSFTPQKPERGRAYGRAALQLGVGLAAGGAGVVPTAVIMGIGGAIAYARAN